MSYLALARKWRPRTFSQLVGQEHISHALINSLNQQRLHHAYLFTGTRGVGKTSIARLLAKALNCEQGIRSEPCLECGNCKAIEQGCFIDLIEVDAASRTGVEETRALLDNVQYATTSGRFKIYLIDEVHMLSQHSFNALLKTLEEPPEHVKFLLATTDPHKLPATVLSRCLQFNLRHLPPELISQHLGHILTQEQIAFEEEALHILALAAKGSMRDSLSMLDQAIAGSQDKIHAQDIKRLLGHTQQDYALKLLHALSTQDSNTLLELSRHIAIEGGQFNYVLDEMLQHLHQIAIFQAIQNNTFLSLPEPDLQHLAKTLSAEDVQLFYQIALKGSEDIHLAPTMGTGFEMTLLRMLAFRPAPDAKPQPRLLQEQYQKTVEKQTTPSKPETLAEATSPPVTKPEPVKVVTSTQDMDWASILKHLDLSGFSLNAAENAELLGKEEGQLFLGVAKGHVSLFTPTVMTRIESALSTYFQQKIKVILKTNEVVKSSPAQQKEHNTKQNLENAKEALQNDSVFQQLQDTFSAQIIKNSIEPVQNDL